jgi:hypothetical protein
MREDAPPEVDSMITGEGRCMKNSKIIALDCDGVLLDYGLAYGVAWNRAFGEAPILHNPNAYSPIDRWKVPMLSGQALEQLRGAFDEVFWSSIPAIDGALEACQLLVDAGHELVCVTAISDLHQPARRRSQKRLGFDCDVMQLREASRRNPKAFALNALIALPLWTTLRHIWSRRRNHPQSSYLEDQTVAQTWASVELANSTHGNLSDFAHWWCGH